MTDSEARKVLAYLKAMFPEYDLGPETAAGYADALRPVAFESVMLAARQHVATQKWFPKVAELLNPIAEQQVSLEPAEQAWLEVKRAIHRWGRYREWTFDNPATALAVETIGKEALCNADEGLVAERAHFFRVYESYRTRELTAAKSAPLLGREYKRLSAPAAIGDVVANMLRGRNDGDR